MIRKRLWIVALVVPSVITAQSDGQESALHENDWVVFYGDCITAQRPYTRYMPGM